MDQFVDRFNGCAIASGHFSRPNASNLGERALQKTWQFELDTDFDLMCVEPPDYACAVGRWLASLARGRVQLSRYRTLKCRGFRLIHLLQDDPSSCGRYTPVSRRGSPAALRDWFGT